MAKSSEQQLFSREVDKRYQVLNSLFMSLPYEGMENIGTLLPFLYQLSKSGFEEGKTPAEIIDEFFEKHTYITDEKQRNDLLFVMIQYIEREVVLFDSIEDSSFSVLHENDYHGRISNLFSVARRNNKLSEVIEKMETYKVRVVFTAHPTQFYPNSVLRIIHELEEAIQANDLNWIDTLLQQLGRTPFINREKPTPLDEAKSIIYYLRNVYYDAIGEMHQKMMEDISDAGNPDFKKVLELGFWPGGDRDGNPFVNADITRQVSNELRYAILKCYYNHLKSLSRRLTFSGVYEQIMNLRERVYVNMFGQQHDLSVEEMTLGLDQISTTLDEKHNGFFKEYLEEFRNRVKLFGLHFASLDIRQDSSIHLKLYNEIYHLAGNTDQSYEDLSEEERIKFLTSADLILNEDDFEDPILRDTVVNTKQLKDIQKQNGEMACHRYIISNSTAVSHVLEVYTLFRLCGYQKEDIHFDIIPLFETVDGMKAAPEVMNYLYNDEYYRPHLDRRKAIQTIMLGFSDGTKDGGYVQANWGIYRTKENLTAVSEENDIKVVFFDGRGGPPARGGGKTHQFYAAQGQTIADHELQLTIQGQTITSVYGSKDQAIYNFEQLVTAGLESSVFHRPETNMKPEYREMMNELAKDSYQKYLDLKADPMFLPYLTEMSTLKYYGKTNIGSRPSKRGNKDTLDFKDLRAIPFVGSWSQLRQNVPGYYGFGTALEEMIEEGKLDELRDMFEHSLFFKTLMSNSMMSISKTYFPLTMYMKNSEKFKNFWENLYDEYRISKETMLEVSQYETLMQDSKLSELSVQYREKIVLPLLTIQQYALGKIKEDLDPESRAVFEKMVTRSLFGNINASRNSA